MSQRKGDIITEHIAALLTTCAVTREQTELCMYVHLKGKNSESKTLLPFAIHISNCPKTEMCLC